MVYQRTVGRVGGLKVTIEVEGSNEDLANLVYADLVGRGQELHQIATGTPPDETQRHMSADWQSYLEDDA